MEQEIFAQLNGGARFDPAKCGAHIRLFKKGKRRTSYMNKKLAQSEAPASLDFFGARKKGPASASGGKKRKRALATMLAADVGASRLSPAKSSRKGSNSISDTTSANGSDSSASDADETDAASDGDDAITGAGPALFSSSDLDTRTVDPAAAEARKHEQEIAQAAAALKRFRKSMGIKVSGNDVAPPMESFHDMELPQEASHMHRVLLENIERSKYIDPTPVQMQSIPVMLAGRDIMAAAPTGSGKTAAFTIPLLAKLQAPKKGSGARALVLAPTRELGSQIVRELERLSKGKKFKIVHLSKATAAAVASDTGRVDVLVSTPLQVLQVAKRSGGESRLRLSDVELIVLDEADKLFEMDGGFLQQLDDVLAACDNPRLQRAFFSATLPQGVEELARTVLRDPVRLIVGTRGAGASTIDQELLFVGMEQGKLLAVRQLVQAGLKPPCIIFVQSRQRAQELFRELVYDGINVDVIHSDRTKAQREQIVKRFRTGSIWVLIATDLMGRGLDFKGVKTVINFDFPQSAVSYVHRIGRTGRAGRRGRAVTFFTESDMPQLRTIANVMKLSGCDVPAWMLAIKKQNRGDRKRLETSEVKRRPISTASAFDRRRAARKANIIKQSKAKKLRLQREAAKSGVGRRSGKKAKKVKGGKAVTVEANDGGGWSSAAVFNRA
jgi:ATP-dependent RNA helicase DDX52/ROK1